MTDKSGIGTFVNEQHELATTSLDLFAAPEIERAQISGRTQTYYMQATISDNGPYEFIIPSESSEFTQLDSIYLYGECSILKSDLTEFAADADFKLVPVNNFPQTLFRQVEVYLNNQCVNDLSTPTYPYKAYIENHLSYDKDIKLTTLEAREMYIKDDVGKEKVLDELIKASNAKKRVDRACKKTICFHMKLHVDFLQSKRYLIPGVEIKIKLLRNEDTFSLIEATKLGAIKMKHLEMNVRKISIEPSVVNSIESKLANTPVMYPIAHSKIKTFLLNSGIKSQHISQLVRGKLPRSFIISFVSSKAFDGDHTSNPFVFEHFNLSNMNVYINGEPIHPKAVQPTWKDDGALRQYSWMLENIGLHQDQSNGVTYADFVSNSVFFPYDNSPDLSNSFWYYGTDMGTIDIHVGFETALTENVTLIFYATFDETVLIDKTRNVSIV